MASPGQRRGNCGHIMAAFDGHKKCARCRDKKLGDDPCVKNQLCTICDSFTEQQRSMLSTPQYKIRKDKKSGLLVSPSKVTVVGVVPQEELGGDELEEEDVPVQASGSGDQEVFSITHHSPEEFVSKQDFDNLNNKLEEKFARFEALLTRTNIFSTPKAPVTNTAVITSEQPFFNPSEPGATGPVRPPASDGQISHPKDAKNKGTGKKLKKKKTVPTATVVSEAPAPVKEHTVSTSLPTQHTEQPAKVDIPVPGSALSLSSGGDSIFKPATLSGSSTLSAPVTGASGVGQSFFADPDASDVDSNHDQSNKDSDEGEISDSETTEQNEEMNYRETCRAVRAFLGWTHIPDFELSVSDGDTSNNPWKGKRPRKTGKVSVEFPPDDWLCHKMEKLNCRVAEGYPSRSQESAGLKVDQFIRTPKSQSKWYRQHRLRQESSSRPGRTIFSWSDSEARLNAQYSRVAKASSYPQSGPASRPVPQDILRRWEKCAREGTYITNHAAAFNKCTSEIQDKMNSHISLLNDVIVKGKAPKEVVDAIRDLKDLSSFHSSVSVALGTSLQHLADGLFIQLANFILLRRDSYLEFAKPGLKPDSWNRLRNAPLFSSSLFPDDILAAAEQDIAKFESTPSAQGPGPGTGQHSGRKHQSYRYKPYDKKDSRQSGHSSSQSSQPWRQFSYRGRGRGRGRGGSNSSHFSRSSRQQSYK